MRSDLPPTDPAQPDERLRWTWVGLGALLGAVLISVVVYVIDPRLDRPQVTGLVVTLSLILVGMAVGYHSRGETIRETAIVGVILMLLAGIAAVTVVHAPVPGAVWVLGPFYAATLSMAGGWVGEMLQGTLEEAHHDEPLDWPWVFASVVIGFTLSAYMVSLSEALFGLSGSQLLLVLAFSFLVTGLIVGAFSPGFTMIEPAIAALGMIVLNGGLVILWFDRLPARPILLGFAAGTVLALVGGWAGERAQELFAGGESHEAAPSESESGHD